MIHDRWKWSVLQHVFHVFSEKAIMVMWQAPFYTKQTCFVTLGEDDSQRFIIPLFALWSLSKNYSRFSCNLDIALNHVANILLLIVQTWNNHSFGLHFGANDLIHISITVTILFSFLQKLSHLFAVLWCRVLPDVVRQWIHFRSWDVEKRVLAGAVCQCSPRLACVWSLKVSLNGGAVLRLRMKGYDAASPICFVC